MNIEIALLGALLALVFTLLLGAFVMDYHETTEKYTAMTEMVKNGHNPELVACLVHRN